MPQATQTRVTTAQLQEGMRVFRGDLDNLANNQAGLQTGQSGLRSDIRGLHEEFETLKRDLNLVGPIAKQATLDDMARRYNELLGRFHSHLELVSLNLSHTDGRVDDIIKKTKVSSEGVVIKGIDWGMWGLAVLSGLVVGFLFWTVTNATISAHHAGYLGGLRTAAAAIIVGVVACLLVSSGDELKIKIKSKLDFSGVRGQFEVPDNDEEEVSASTPAGTPSGQPTQELVVAAKAVPLGRKADTDITAQKA